MKLDQRSETLLRLFIINSGYLSAAKLIEDLGVSKRTFQYELKKVNAVLEVNGFAKITHIRGHGYHLSKQQRGKIRDWLKNETAQRYYFTSEERILRILAYLLVLPQRIVLDDLTESNYVSRNTTLDDIKKIRQKLRQFQLDMQYDSEKGNQILGDEKIIRHFFVSECLKWIEEKSSSSLIDFLQVNTPLPEHQMFGQFDYAKHLIIEAEENLKIRYTDELVDKLAFFVAFFKERMKQCAFVQHQPEMAGEAVRYAEIIYQGLQKQEKFSVAVDEFTYLSTFLLGANRLKDQQETNVEIEKCAINMIREFERLAYVHFDDFTALKEALILHLRPAFYRIKFQVQWINPIFTDIKKEYRDVFDITKQTIRPFEELLDEEISEDEISFIAILFGGYLSRKESILVKKKKLLIICSKGIGTSRMLEQQLQEILQDKVEIVAPMSIREYEQQEIKADFIVSTIPIIDECQHIFIVSPILTENQKQTILKEVLPYALQNDSDARLLASVLDVIEEHADVQQRELMIDQLKQVLFRVEHRGQFDSSPSLVELLPESRIQLLATVENWEQAIEIATKPLVETGFVAEYFHEAMIANVKKLGPYIVIAPGIAFPHANVEEGAYRVGMSLLYLQKPVAFSNKAKDQVQLIIVLASIDSFTHINALSQLTTLITKENFYNKVKQAKNTQAVAALLNN